MFTTDVQSNQQNTGQAGQWLLDTAISPAQAITNTYVPISLNEMANVALYGRFLHS